MYLRDYSPCLRKLQSVASLTRPACKDSGDALQHRLLGRIYLNSRSGEITSNPVAAALTAPQRPATFSKRNPTGPNPHSNSERNASYLVMASKRSRSRHFNLAYY